MVARKVQRGSSRVQFGRRIAFAAVAICAVASLTSFAADRTISADYALTADETVDGVLTVDSGATVDLAGHTLTVKGLAGGGTITSGKYSLDTSIAVPEIVSGESIFWLDASASDTLTIEDGLVKAWASRKGSNVAKYLVGGCTNPGFDDTTYGIPTVDFGAVGSKKDLAFDALKNIRTVFLVTKIQKSPNAFWLASANLGTYDFHRGEGSQYCASYSNFAKMWNGTMQANMLTEVPDDTGFIVVVGEMKGASTANSLTNDRDINGRNGGKQLSELICFSRVLTDAERVAVTEYLQKKWLVPAELRVQVSGSAENSTVALTGNVKLVVEGGGTFTASKASQSYTGGTEVTGSGTTLVAGTATHPFGNGNATQTVTVGGNGILNLATYKSESTCYYNLVLDEGAVVQAGDAGDRGTGRIASITLNGNATVKLSQKTLFGGSSAAKACQLTFRGHTLTLLSLGDGNLGHVHVNDYGTFRLDANNSNTTCPGMYRCEFDLRGAKLEVTERAFVKFGNWAFYATDFVYGGLNKFTGGGCNKINSVYGRYVAGNYRPPFTMQDGSTLDLSKVSGVWSAAGAAIPSSHKDVTGPGMVSFASGATINIDVGERTIAAGDRLVQFASEPSGISFTTPQSMIDANLTNIVRQIDGVWYLYVRSTEIPYARWHIDATTPANSGWKFYNSVTGVERLDWDEGITEDVEVRIFSYAEHQAIVAAGVSPFRYSLYGTIQIPGDAAEWNLTTCFDGMAEGASIDLNGKKLHLNRIDFDGTITDTSADTDYPGELHVTVASGTIANTRVSLKGNLKLVKEGAGTFTASKANQSYTGGTEVQSGTLLLGTASHPLGDGNGTQTVTVRENATVNLNDRRNASTCNYNFELYEGSTLNAGAVSGRWVRQFQSITLHGNASFRATGNVLFGTNVGTPSTLTLNGYALSLYLSNDPNMRGVIALDAGKIVFRAGFATFYGQTARPIDFTKATLEFRDSAYFYNGGSESGTFNVGGLYFDGTTKKWASQGLEPMKVHGRYVAGVFRAPFTMMDGSTLDLSEMSGTWNSSGCDLNKNNAVHTETGLVTFASGATVTVDLSGRTDLRELAKSATPYVVTWSSQPNATFTLDAETAERFKIKPDGTGIKLVRRSGLMILVK